MAGLLRTLKSVHASQFDALTLSDTFLVDFVTFLQALTDWVTL